MPKRKLNELAIQYLPIPKAGQVDYFDSTLPCFGVRVSLGGTKTYFLHYQNRRSTLGRVGITTLKEARDEARRRLNSKYFPSKVTTQQAIDWYLEAIKGEKRPATHKVYELYLNRLPRADLSRLEASQLYAALPQGKSAANLCFATWRAFFSHCVERGHLAANPLTGRRQPNKVKSRDRLLSDEEVRLIWKESYNHNHFGAIVRILLLSGQRLSQITHIQAPFLQGTSHNQRVMIFPAYVMKSGTEHTIPLLPLVDKELASLPFPKLHISHQMKVFREALNARTSLTGGSREIEWVQDLPPIIPHFTLHDFRRYLSSTMSRLKVPIDITEAILAHRSGSRSQIQRTYDRDARIPQMREALSLYEQHLLAIIGE